MSVTPDASGRQPQIRNIAGAAALTLARQRFPKISADGTMVVYRGAPRQEIVPEQVERAMAFLSRLTPTKTPRASSYGMKHCAENWAGGYISNGAVIVGAMSLGLVVEPTAKRWWQLNPNCMIGVSQKDLKKISEETLRLRRERGCKIIATSALTDSESHHILKKLS